MFPAVRGPPAREVQEGGGPGENRLVRLQPRSPFDASARAGGAGLPAEGIRSRVFPPPPLKLPGRPGGCACAPAPSPGGRRASDSGGGDGPRGKPGGWGRGVACTWPLSAAQAREGRAWTPASPEGAAGEGSLPPRPGEVRDRGGETSHTTGAADTRARVRSARRPLPEPRWAGSPGRSRSPAAGNSRSSPSSRRCAPPGLPRLPEGEPHAGRPTDRAARPRPHPVPLGEAAT